MNIQAVSTKAKNITSIGALKVRKYSPELLLGVGIAGTIGATILACNATLKSQAVLSEHRGKLNDVEKATALNSEKYTEEDRRKDLAIVYVQTGTEFLKLYGPAISLYAASIVCILGGHHIMRKRNVAILGAYKLLEQGWNEYRGRVVDELGEEKDMQFRYGTVEETQTDKVTGKDGKTKRVKTKIQKLGSDEKYSVYARLFEPQQFEHGGTWSGSSQWSSIHHYNYAFISEKLKWFNDRLTAEGYLFLNDVYEELGFPRTAVGQQVGWVKKNEEGDGYISFGPGFDLLAYNDGDPILLDFNVDGFVLDLI